MISLCGTNPTVPRLSLLTGRLSPITQTCPSGTLTGPQLKKERLVTYSSSTCSPLTKTIPFLSSTVSPPTAIIRLIKMFPGTFKAMISPRLGSPNRYETFSTMIRSPSIKVFHRRTLYYEPPIKVVIITVAIMADQCL